MIFPAPPRGRDAQLSRGPSERDLEAETEERNQGYDIACERAKDDAMREDEEDMRREQEGARHDELMNQAREDARRKA